MQYFYVIVTLAFWIAIVVSGLYVARLAARALDQLWWK